MSAPDVNRPKMGAAVAPSAGSSPGSSAAEQLQRALDRISRVRGVRGSMWVAADDGIPVAQLLMEGVKGKAIAAFAASLARKVSGASAATGAGRVRFVQMEAAGGTLLVAPTSDELLIVALADSRVNVGLARLEMIRAAEAARP
jgi:predicted regulator of Ras-like GTPase activity (Roadblock/LC7/MglB family)